MGKLALFIPVGKVGEYSGCFTTHTGLIIPPATLACLLPLTLGFLGGSFAFVVADVSREGWLGQEVQRLVTTVLAARQAATH